MLHKVLPIKQSTALGCLKSYSTEQPTIATELCMEACQVTFYHPCLLHAGISCRWALMYEADTNRPDRPSTSNASLQCNPVLCLAHGLHHAGVSSCSNIAAIADDDAQSLGGTPQLMGASQTLSAIMCMHMHLRVAISCCKCLKATRYTYCYTLL